MERVRRGARATGDLVCTIAYVPVGESLQSSLQRLARTTMAARAGGLHNGTT
jgi:hypothetical protein